MRKLFLALFLTLILPLNAGAQIQGFSGLQSAAFKKIINEWLTGGLTYGDCTTDCVTVTSNVAGQGQFAVNFGPKSGTVGITSGTFTADNFVKTNSQGIFVDSGIAAGAAISDVSVRLRTNASQNIPPGTNTAIAFDIEVFKTVSGLHSNSTNNSRITITSAGKYLVMGNAGFSPDADATDNDFRLICIRLNGSSCIVAQQIMNNGAADTSINEPIMSVGTIYDFSVDDYIELMVYQNSGGSIPTVTWVVSFVAKKVS